MITKAANQAESLTVRRYKDLSKMHDMSVRFNERTVNSGIPANVVPLLSQGRFRKRLERRALRRFGAFSDLSALIARDVTYLTTASDRELECIIADIGAYCHYAPLRRILDPSDLEELSSETGIDLTRHEARGFSESSAMSIAYELPGTEHTNTLSEQADLIRRDGALCFACWLDQKPPGAQRLLWAQIPDSLREIMPLSGNRSKREIDRRAALVGARLAVLQEGHDDLQES